MLTTNNEETFFHCYCDDCTTHVGILVSS